MKICQVSVTYHEYGDAFRDVCDSHWIIHHLNKYLNIYLVLSSSLKFLSEKLNYAHTDIFR